ncbi:hypothetical protein [Legionella waltersii]|uniref:VirK protein n=1 Tax=Legionella waltersii TaxID=66969 RepID=A0A0W1ADT0_9GAMM|nr:hypothetical protein [Legionella waltersii]KTD79428.1 hypothetical protein Lwal_1500 [Legionella waltersii]SNU97702.1 Uncharacterised protein [Legionella waltersii]
MNSLKIRSILFSLALLFPGFGLADTHRDSVTKQEVNGTFTMHFPDPYKDEANTLTVKALGGGKINVSFELIYPYKVNGELLANTGELSGVAKIEGDTAVYQSSEFGECTITITFVKPGMLTVKQDGSDADCGFGHNVTADGTYYK